MFNIGPMEFLVIAVLALVVLGPERLPDAARQAGKVMGDLRKLSSGFQHEMKSAFDDADGASSAPVAPVAAPIEPGPEADVPEPAMAPTSAVAAVSGQARAARTTPKSTPASRKPPTATKKAPAKKAPAKKSVNGNTARSSAPKKTTTSNKKASATKTTAKSSATTKQARKPATASKATPAKKSATRSARG